MLRALGLGDLLAAVPALRALRAALPQHRITLAAPRWQQPLLAPDALVDDVWDTDGLHPLAWPGPPPDLAVNLHGRGPQSHAILALLRPRHWVAFRSAEAGVAGPPWRPDEHERARWSRLVGSCLAVDTDPDDVALTPPAGQPPASGVVVVHPGAAHPARQWRPERFASVARALRGEGLPVVVTGSDAERPLAAAVAQAAGLTGDAVLAGRTTVPQLASLVAAAALVVSGDTGVAHLATAYRTPSVVLFGPTPPQWWGPPADGPHTVLWHGSGAAGDPWGQRVDPALDRIQVDEVLSAVRSRLASVS